MKGAIFVESQPPHAGEIATVRYNINNYDSIYLCIYGKPLVMDINHARALWAVFLSDYKDKVEVVVLNSRPEDFKTGLPDILKGCELVTTSQKAFVRLSSFNAPVKLVSRTLGYHSIFVRAAYRQSRALDWLQSHAATKANKEIGEKK